MPRNSTVMDLRKLTLLGWWAWVSEDDWKLCSLSRGTHSLFFPLSPLDVFKLYFTWDLALSD